MALNSQFSLSVEITRLLPLGPILNASGRYFLNLARNLQSSGSNIVVEADLAGVFGRNRIESRFESSFRTVVKESGTHRLNEFLDIVLESGAGPTVQRSLQDQAYFSTVVQVSLLTSMLDIQTLAAGINEVFARRAEDIPTEPYCCPTYDSMFGALRAIRDQTSAFNWSLISDAVTSSLGSGFEQQIARDSLRGFSWVLPAAILQGCLDFFAMVQHFPNERIIQIRTRSIYSDHKLHQLIIIWAHHVLGLTVALCSEDGRIYMKFGCGDENVVILAHDYVYQSEICLLDGTRQQIFQISESLDDPEITSDERFPALGFAVKCLAGREYYRQIIQQSLEYCKTWFGESSKTIDFQKLQQAGVFLFGEEFEAIQVNDAQTRLSLPPDFDEDVVKPLSRALYAFTHVANLDGLETLPMSLRALKGVDRNSFRNGREPFEYMIRLLHGHIDIQNPILVSSRGWSIYTNILTLPDPTDVLAPLIFVSRGVPSRAGERKHFIIDGVSPRRNQTPDVQYHPHDVSRTAKLVCAFDVSKPRWLVGTSNSAFVVVIKFELEPQHRASSNGSGWCCRMMFKAGLMELEALALETSKIPPCYHQEAAPATEFEVPLGSQIFSSALSFNDPRPAFATSSNIFISLSAWNQSARWFCLLLAQQERRTIHATQAALPLRNVFLRNENTCPRCCINSVKEINMITDMEDGIDRVLAVIIL